MSVTVLSLKDYRDIDPSWHNVTSHSTTWTRQLSPFILGPVPVQPLDEEFTSIMEGTTQPGEFVSGSHTFPTDDTKG